ncbi:MAG: hypothetical protein AAF724_10380 [Pseudomonadota bacterium]
MTFPKILLLVTICTTLTFAAASADPEEDVDLITRSLITEASYFAVMSAKKAEISREMRKRIDFSGVSESDFDTFMELFVEETARSMVVGLRKAFQMKLLEMPPADIATMVSCMQGKKCTEDDYSAEGIEVIRDLPRFGKVEGERIGRVVGVAISPELIEIVRSNPGNRFENPAAVVQVLSNPLR